MGLAMYPRVGLQHFLTPKSCYICDEYQQLRYERPLCSHPILSARHVKINLISVAELKGLEVQFRHRR